MEGRAFSSAEKQLVSNQRAQRDVRRTPPHSRRQTDTLACRGTYRNPRNCTFPEPSLFQDGESSFSTFSSTPPPPTPRPQSAFLPPSWSRSVSSIDFSQQPSPPAVDSAPASSKFHSVIFIFVIFFSPSSMFIHDCGSERGDKEPSAELAPGAARALSQCARKNTQEQI